MWNKLKEISQDLGYRRLAIALCVSILLHSMVFGGFDLSLPILKKEMHTIDARLQMPKAAPAPKLEPVPPVEPVNPEPSKPVASKSEPEIAKVEPPPTPVTELPVTSPEPIPETPAPQAAPVLPPQPEPVEKVAELPPAKDEGLVINQNAYQYAETYFDVSTKIDGLAEGKAKMVFNLLDNNQYQMSFLTEAKGLAALVISDLLQTSDGALTKTGLQPQHYLYQYGSKEDKTRKAVFDWQANTLQMTTSKGAKTENLLEGAQDLLSFMYQFMYVAPLQNMQIPITNGKNLRVYDYSFEGEENVNSKLGEVKTIHIVHTAGDSDEKTELWLAVDYQYLPVKIRKTEKDNKVYEFVATRVVTTRPTIDR